MDNPGTKNVVERFMWLLRHRPAYLFRAGRGYALFHWARFIRLFFVLPGVSLAQNVRLQRNASLSAERPNATITVGAHSVVYEDARIEAYGEGRILIGAYSIIGDARILSRYRIQIGARLLSSWNVFIQDYDPHPTDPTLRRQQVEHMVASFRPSFLAEQLQARPPEDWNFPGEDIIIGDDVWLGAGSTILKGAKIGDGSVVATGAVVLKGDYPTLSLIAGNPARVVKKLSHLTVSPIARLGDEDHTETAVV